MRRLAAIVLAAAALAAAGPLAVDLSSPDSATAAAKQKRVLVMTHVIKEKFAYRPHKVVLAPRGIFEVKRIKWRAYGPESATATALVTGRTCERQRCNGPFFKRQAKIHLYDTRRCPGFEAFTILEVNFKGRTPRGWRGYTSFINMPVDNLGYPNCGVKE